MKDAFARLSSFERRFVMGVALIVFILLNAMFVWPRFSEWNRLQFRLTKARNTLARYQSEIAQMPAYQKQVRQLESEGLSVPPEDQTVNLMLTVQSRAAQSGVTIVANRPQPARTNEFFLEQAQSLTVTAGESQLVDFLYHLGDGASLTRVRDLSLMRDASGHQLRADIKLVASYQKKPPVRAAPAAPAAPATPSPAARISRAEPAAPPGSTAKKP
jgi:Tfp pilus assembly protein PilO